MKTSDLQELNPVYLHEASYSTNDEISLVDIAMILVRRKMIIITICLISITLGITVALLTPRTYNFSNSVEIGRKIIKDSEIVLEGPQTLLAKLEHSYIPKTLTKHQSTNKNDKVKYHINASIPKGSNVVLLEISGTENQAETLKGLLNSITQKVIQDHDHISSTVKNNLELRINQANNRLKVLESNNISYAAELESLETLSSQLANLRNTREILSPMKSIDPIGSSKRKIVTVTSIVGILFAIFIAFFAEFVSKIKDRMKDQKTV